jgi:magnesium chelatase family protein
LHRSRGQQTEGAVRAKEGPSFDLPIALGILAANGQVKADRPDEIVFAGELGLDGEVRAISGVLLMAIGARAAGKRAIAVPEANVGEAAVGARCGRIS